MSLFADDSLKDNEMSFENALHLLKEELRTVEKTLSRLLRPVIVYLPQTNIPEFNKEVLQECKDTKAYKTKIPRLIRKEEK